MPVRCHRYVVEPDGSLNGIVDHKEDFFPTPEEYESNTVIFGVAVDYDKETKEFVVDVTDENVSKFIDNNKCYLTSSVAGKINEANEVTEIEKVFSLFLTDEASEGI